jgi:AcrR family transcriptional regulator
MSHRASPLGAPEDEPTAGEGRRLILDTAARLFRQEGYAAISLRDIAGECGMKAGSLYYHFACKDEIVSEVLRIGVERVFEEVRRTVMALPPDADARTLLHTAVRAHLSALLELQDYTSANVRIFGQVPSNVREAHIATRDAYERFWAAVFERCAKLGGFDPERDLHLTRLFLINALNGCLEWYRAGPASLEALAHELTELFLDGLNARTAPHRPAKRTTPARTTPRRP